MVLCVEVVIYGIVRDVLKEPRYQITVPPETKVAEIIRILTSHYGPAFSERILRADGRLESYVALFINQHQIREAELTRPLADFRTSGIPELPVTLFVVPAQEGG